MDEKGYITLAQQHMAALYRTAYSIVGNRADAEDAVQQCLLNAWRMREKAREGTERAWMMRIAINECYAILRSRKRCAPGQIPEGICFPPEDTGLRDALQTLPESLRTPFLLKYMEGMKENEVAASMGLPVAAVKNRLFRARRQLRKLLKEEVEL